MKYFITRLDRTVELDDILVQKYCEYENLREQPFSIVIKSKFGHKPTKEEISDEEDYHKHWETIRMWSKGRGRRNRTQNRHSGL